MSSSASGPGSGIDQRLLRAGVVLMCVGGVAWLTGAALSATALGKAARKWVEGMDQSPVDMAHRRLHQARAAAVAGSRAWREERPH
jgi:hypothetical protein